MNLAAAGWVESGAVENDRRAWSFDHRVNFGVEVVKKGIAVVEAVGHGDVVIRLLSRIGAEGPGYQVWASLAAAGNLDAFEIFNTRNIAVHRVDRPRCYL